MSSFRYKLEMALLLASHGDFGEVLAELWRRFYSNDLFYGLRRDLTDHFEAPPPRYGLRYVKLRMMTYQSS